MTFCSKGIAAVAFIAGSLNHSYFQSGHMILTAFEANPPDCATALNAPASAQLEAPAKCEPTFRRGRRCDPDRSGFSSACHLLLLRRVFMSLLRGLGFRCTSSQWGKSPWHLIQMMQPAMKKAAKLKKIELQITTSS